ncbi:ornithine cyclodeaminase family protein [Corynebacterium pseudopelargi]|uniref:Ornithine cyclodeaminase n=1 Tax=Corynebacterium pseudopelargi TaxID=2080757 RepID=A0A3G6IX29_9CORY|nr:ornithine cyclodeaminase family protein [Corynebacterium pseudopelargi]AZA08670.1 ornithine cyclodeaminase [Corynebacterium pseudopelargi]
MKVFDYAEVQATISPARALSLLTSALKSGVEPAEDPARSITAVPAGQILSMPASIPGWAGAKIIGLAPGNTDLPRIDGTYVLFDGQTLQLQAMIDGVALTNIRTPAVSALAASKLLAPGAVDKLVVFGTGPQGVGHARALADLREVRECVLLGRDAQKAQAAVEELAQMGIQARVGEVSDIRDADVIVCATSAGSALFEAADVRDDVCVLAIGSHETDRREVPAELMGRSLVVVEDVTTALREAGDVVMAIEDGALAESELRTLKDLVLGEVEVDYTKPRVFKGTGMSWEDLAVAVGMMSTQ